MSERLTIFRQRKDEFFRGEPHSPLTPEQQAAFTGLDYYPENPDLRFEAEVEPFDEQVEVQMQTNTGETRTFVRWGYFRFQVGEQPAQLTVYASPGGLSGFFIPFVDATAGEETYKAGRYLDIEPLPGGKFLVDFNMAYSPYCAYNASWVCPFPPPENHLKVPIRAGERKPVGGWVEHA